MRLMAVILAAFIGISVVAACQPTALPPIPQTAADGAEEQHRQRIGIIFENGEAGEYPLYQLALTGADKAAAALAVDVALLEMSHQENGTSSIEGYAHQDYDLLIGIGSQSLQQAIISTAKGKPEQLFVVVGPQVNKPNVFGLQFDMTQPSFLAGYLAAGVSATGMVCTYGSLDVPNAKDYLSGFANGVRYYNVKRGADVALLGWDPTMQAGALSDSFQSSGEERKLVTDYFEAGCDVFFPVTHSINLALASLAQEYEFAVVGAGVDWFVVAPEFGEIWLTSVLKNLDQAVFDTIAALVNDGPIAGGYYAGTLANGGVGLASFHFWDDKIPEDLKIELAEIKQALIDGRLNPTTSDLFD